MELFGEWAVKHIVDGITRRATDTVWTMNITQIESIEELNRLKAERVTCDAEQEGVKIFKWGKCV